MLRKTLQRRFSTSEIADLPPRHRARTDPDLVVTRTEVRPVEMPPFGRVTNRVGVLFDGENPLVAASDPHSVLR